MTLYKVLDKLFYWPITFFLFTKSDMKTIILPVTLAALAVSPPNKLSHLFGAVFWLWIHLLQANTSNQRNAVEEDKLNKPWRPLPSGRITQQGAQRLRWCLFAACLCLSAWHGTALLTASITMTVMVVIHDDIGYSGRPILKNLLNVGAYVVFESGTIMIMSSKNYIDQTSFIAVVISGVLIMTTIHAQDFMDVEGDKLMGRRTLPIVAPEGSRYYISAALPLWSIALSALWGLGPLSASIFLSMGAFVGSQYFRFRDVKNDEKSYLLYNVWLMAAHALPLNVHRQALSW